MDVRYSVANEGEMFDIMNILDGAWLRVILKVGTRKACRNCVLVFFGFGSICRVKFQMSRLVLDQLNLMLKASLLKLTW